MVAAKICGWALLIAGLAIIVWALYSSYNIFTAQASAPEVFKATEKQVQLSTGGGTQDLQAQMEAKMKEAISEQLASMLPANFLINILNLVAWSIFMGILIFGGGQISGLGIKLIKK